MAKIKKSNGTIKRSKSINKSLIAIIVILCLIFIPLSIWGIKELTVKPKKYDDAVLKLPKLDQSKIDGFIAANKENTFVQNLKIEQTGNVIHISFLTPDDVAQADAQNLSNELIKNFDVAMGMDASEITPEYSKLYDDYDVNVVILKSEEANAAQVEFPLFGAKKEKTATIGYTIYGRYEIPEEQKTP